MRLRNTQEGGISSLVEISYGKLHLITLKMPPIFKYGLDNKLMNFAGIDMSTHNTYIHILLQGGLVGLSIFFMFMYSIWKYYFDRLDDDIVITTAAYLIGILVFINFEVTLVGNSVVTAIFLWFILGVGLIECNNMGTKGIVTKRK